MQYDKIYNIDEFFNIALKLNYPLDFLYKYFIRNNRQIDFKKLDDTRPHV